MVERGPPQKSEHVVVLNATVRHDQMAAVKKFQAEQRLVSRSAAVRAILDEWLSALDYPADVVAIEVDA